MRDGETWADYNVVMAELGVPDLVVQRASRNGAAGQRWLDELPDVLDDLASRWGHHGPSSASRNRVPEPSGR